MSQTKFNTQRLTTSAVMIALAAILAMVGTGLYDSVEDACSKLIKDEKTFYPNADNVKRYNEKFAQYKDFQQYSLRSASV